MKNYLKKLDKYPSKFFITLVIFYRNFFSPDNGIFKNFSGFYGCRFYPSCSAYALNSFRQYGLLKGLMMSLKRLIRCNPFSKGGYDPL